MDNDKAIGLDIIITEVLKSLGERDTSWLTKFFNKITRFKKI